VEVKIKAGQTTTMLPSKMKVHINICCEGLRIWYHYSDDNNTVDKKEKGRRGAEMSKSGLLVILPMNGQDALIIPVQVSVELAADCMHVEGRSKDSDVVHGGWISSQIHLSAFTGTGGVQSPGRHTRGNRDLLLKKDGARLNNAGIVLPQSGAHAVEEAWAVYNTSQPIWVGIVNLSEKK
jgi:hypothetical protein